MPPHANAFAALALVLSLGPGGQAQAAEASSALGSAEIASADVAVQAGSVEGLGTIEGLGDVDGLADIEQLSLDAMLGTVTAASRREEGILKAPAAVTVFEAEDVRRSGAMDLPDLLRMVPGVQVQRFGPGGVTVWMRGTGSLDSNSVVILLDGLPISDPFDGAVDWSSIPVTIEDVRRVEVIRGPVSTVYGAGAHSGVVAITTWDRDMPPPTSANVAMGVDDRGRLASQVGARLGSSGSGPLRFQLRADGAFNDTWSDSEAGKLPGAMRLNGQGRVWWQPVSGSVLLADLGFTFADRSDLATFLARPDERHRRAYLVSLRYQQKAAGLIESWELAARFSAYALARTVGPEVTLGDTRSVSMNGYVGAYANLHFADWLVGNGGFEGYMNWGRAPFLSPEVNAKWRPWLATYLNLDADVLPWLRLNAAGRLDYQTTGESLEPSIRASAIWWGDLGSLRLSSLSSFRDPSFLERGANYTTPDGTMGLLGVEDLKRPRNSTVELAAQSVPMEGWNAQLVTFFGGGPVVYRVAQDGPDTLDSLGYVRTFGEELQVDWRGQDLAVRGSLTLLQMFRPPETQHQVGESAAVVASLWVRGSGLGQALQWSLGGTFASARSYDTLAGLESRPLVGQIPAQALVSGLVRYRLFGSPFSVYSRAQLNVPFGVPQAPHPEAGLQGALLMAGVEYLP